jgi:hypothetical protein
MAHGVRTIIGAQQHQHSLRLTPAIALLFQQSLKKPFTDFAQFAESQTQLLQLATMVSGRTMPRVLLFLSCLSDEQQVPPQLFDAPIVNNQLPLRHSHR